MIERITLDPAVCHGKPTIRGLRYPVEMILELFSAGMSVEDILADYEDLERDDILAALSCAAHTELAQEEGLMEGEYPVWSPYDAHEAAATLMQLLEHEKVKREIREAAP